MSTAIRDTTVYPWRAVCSLTAAVDGGEEWGTGWFVGPRTVVTAAHVVCPEGRRATSVTVVPGRAADDAPNGSAISSTFDIAPGWGPQGSALDVAAIQLEEDLGRRLGWFAVKAPNDQELRASNIVLAGFPLRPNEEVRMFCSAGPVRSCGPDRVLYDFPCAEGQSGSPVWLEPTDPIAARTVVALHAWGTDLSPPDLAPPASSGPRMTAEVITLINRWTRNRG